MKRLFVFIIISIFICSFAFADRYVNAWECSSAGDMLSRIQVGTVVDFDGTIDETMSGHIITTPAIRGCSMFIHAYIPMSSKPQHHIPGTLYHINGTVSKLGNNKTVFYLTDVTLSQATIERRTLCLNDITLYSDGATIYDTFTGTGTVLNTSDIKSHLVLIRSGSTKLYFATSEKQFYKNDNIEFTGTIDYYDDRIDAYHITFSSVLLIH